MNGSRLPLWGTLAGVVVGTVVAASLFAGGVLRVPAERDLSDAQADLLAAWQRSRTGTFVVESEFRRTIDGRTLYSPTQLVQRPPDRMVRQFGGVSGTVDGHPLLCATDQAGQFTCTPSPQPANPYDDVVAREVDELRAYFTPPQPGAKPLYRVVRGTDSGCFELLRQLPVDDAPYGTYGKLCFDEATGALTTLERHLDRGVVERQSSISIRTAVIQSDFSTATDDGYGLSMDLGSPPVAEPDSAAPADGSGQVTPGTTADPAPERDLTSLDLAALISGGSSAAGPERDPYVLEAVNRLLAGKAGINDPLWRDVWDQPMPLAEPVILELLRRGAIPFG